jgi:D-alanine transaminase
MSDNIVYLNGEYLPIEQASVSVMDRGFLFGDAVYEVIPVFGRHMLRLSEHLQRLHNSLTLASMQSPMNDAEWTQLFTTLLEKNPGADRAIYLQVTRGVYPKRDLTIKPEYKATVFAMVIHTTPMPMAEIEKGLRAVTIEDFRWHACNIKSTSLIANVMLRHQASEAEVSDAILVRAGGEVTEGTASNIFIVKQGVIVTPPTSNHLLPGITRDLVLDLAKQNGLSCEVRNINQDELETADEIWMTGSIREIAPVLELNGKPVADGKPGPVWRKMITIYLQHKQELRNA